MEKWELKMAKINKNGDNIKGNGLNWFYWWEKELKTNKNKEKRVKLRPEKV